MRVLVIEDEEDLRDELAATVKERLVGLFPNTAVRYVSTREEVMALLDAGEKFDISIVDIILGEHPRGYYTYLPDARGYEGVEIYQGNRSKLGKVIFITNSATHRRLRMLWPEVDKETVCLKDLPYGTSPDQDWPENLYAAISKAGAEQDGATKPKQPNTKVNR